jgi:hypothetical protein
MEEFVEDNLNITENAMEEERFFDSLFGRFSHLSRKYTAP